MIMEDRNYTRPAPQEPFVHKKSSFYVCLILSVWCFLCSISKLFTGNIYTMEGWWNFLIPAAVFLLLALLLSKRRDRELRAHEAWKNAYYEWRQEQEDLAQKAHSREMKRLEKQLEVEKASLERTKVQIRKEFGATARNPARAEDYSVAGTSYRQDVFERLGLENPDYSLTNQEIISEGREDEHFDKYYFDPLPVDLEKDPDNPYGDHAVKVLLAGEHVGYIPSERSAHVTELIDSGQIADLDAEIVGGPYKYYDSVEESMVKENLKFGVRLTIYLK